MTGLLHVIVAVIGVVLLIGSGYVVGYRYGRLNGAEEAVERLSRIDPPKRRPGTPTNVDAPPSEPRSPRWRTGQFKSGPPYQM